MPDILYAARGGSSTTSDLYTIDPATAVPTTVGPIGYALTALAFHPITGVLYGATTNNSADDPRSLVTVDPDTGAATLIGELDPGGDNASDIAFASDGTLYAWTAFDGQLATIDLTTGVMTIYGVNTGEFGGGLSFVGPTLYHIPRLATGDIETLDLLDGSPTVVVAMAASAQVTCAAYGSGAMYVSEKGTNYLETIDLVTGAATNIGIIGTGQPFDALAWGPAPTPPPPFTGTVQADLPWRFFVTDRDARTLSIIDRRATDKQLLFTLNGPAYHTGQVASDDNEINQAFPTADDPALLTNNRRLLYGMRRELRASPSDPPYVCRFGGILMSVEDQGTDAPTTRYTAFDPWQYMMNRPIRQPDPPYDLPEVDGLKFPPGSRASDIALTLLETTQAVEGETHIDFSDSGLIEASTPLTYGIKFDAGLSVGEAWQQLCGTGTIDIHLDPMYEPISAPGKVCQFRVVAQTSGTAAGPVVYDAVMAWDGPGHSLTSISRLIDGTRLANRVQYFAGQGGLPVPLQSDAASITEYGEYWAQQFFPGTQDRILVALIAVADLAIRRNGARSISFDPAPERSDLELLTYNLGDYLPVWASRNLREPLMVDYDSFDADNPGASGYQRVYVIPIAIDDAGVSKVTGILTASETASG